MKIWYSIFNRNAYKGIEPAFYLKQNFHWIEFVEFNWLKIRSELETHLLSNPRLNSGNKSQLVNNHGSWKTMPLMTWGVEFHRNIINFPNTISVLKQVPGLVSVSFNLLEKNSEINSHFGETNACVRVHLGLFIPDDASKIGFKVNDISKSWEKGKVMVFCDAYEHNAWNHTDQDRYIILLDIIRPEFIHKKRLICANVLASLALQSIANKNAIIFYVILIPLSIIHFLAKLFFIILVPFYNSFSYYRNKKRV